MSAKKVFAVIPEKIGRIAPEIYGHFSEHIGGVFYGGLWVGKDSKIPNIKGFRRDAVEKFKKIRPGVLRWPGGCFAETHDWRDGIGENRPVRKNWWYPHDRSLETNEVGTHEFMDFCEAVGVKPYFAMNVTSITPMQARSWMDYCLSPRGSTTLALEREKNGHPEPFCIPYWGVGNENWGGGGNMTADFYALEYRRFATLMRNISKTEGCRFVAGGANGKDYGWTRDLAQNLSGSFAPVNAVSFHYYTGTKSDCFDLSKEAWYTMIEKAAGIEEAIERHSAVIKGFGMENKMPLVIDEWGSWYPEGSGPSRGKNLFEEQSTLRDAVITALSLNVFNNHADKIIMTNVAQLCNNLHCLFLSDGVDLITTPTYHVFDMFKEHQNGEAIRTLIEDNGDPESRISVSASLKDGKLFVTAANMTLDNDLEFSFELLGAKGEAENALLLSENDPASHNTFEAPERVTPKNAAAPDLKRIALPHASVLAFTVRLG